MATAADRMREAKPRRLRRQEGVWTLDIERFIPLGQGVLRPRVESLQGETVIVQYLSQHPAANGLGRNASQLMRDTGPEAKSPHQVFEAVGEGWIPVFGSDVPEPEPVYVAPPPRVSWPAAPPPPPARVESPDYDALVRALGALRLLHNKLQARVDELERKLSLAEKTAPTIGVSDHAPRSPHPASVPPRVSPTDASAETQTLTGLKR